MPTSPKGRKIDQLPLKDIQIVISIFPWYYRDMIVSKHKKVFVITLVILLAFASILTVVLTQSSNRPLQNTGAANNKPSFHFDSLRATGWSSSGNIRQDFRDYTGGQVTKDDLATAQISISQGAPNKPANCFIDYYYWEKAVNPAIALAEMKQRSVEGDADVMLNSLGIQTLTISTPDGIKELELNQYEFTGPGSKTRAKGVQFGYLPLSNGYIEVRSYCNTTEQLTDALPALRAVSLANQ